MEQAHEVSVININSSGRPHALVFAGRVKPLSAGEAKRARFVQYLNTNYRKLKESLDFIERFALTNQISQVRVDALKKCSAEMLGELTAIFESKLEAYEKRRNP